MKDFLFRPEQARTPLKALSGGERGRLMLARALARPANLLVLDEPTNDLDLETLDLLEEMLDTYDGTLLLVSHDRDFLDRVVTSVVASEGDGVWTEYAGGYSDMVAQRGYGIGGRPLKARAASPEPERQPPEHPRGDGRRSPAGIADAKAPHLLRPARPEDTAGEDRRPDPGRRTPGSNARRSRSLRSRSGGLRREQHRARSRARRPRHGGGGVASR